MPQNIISQFARQYSSPIETNRQVANTTARDAIASGLRWEGMLVYVISDGVTYELRGGVTNTDWYLFGDGLADAPNDGNEYVRKNGAWALASSGIVEAPIDGTTYGRNNGTWQAVSAGGGAVDSVFGRTGAVVAQASDYSGLYAAVSHNHTLANITDYSTDSGDGTVTLVGSGGGSYSVSTVSGYANNYFYRVDGKTVYIHIGIVITGNTGSPSGILQLTLDSLPTNLYPNNNALVAAGSVNESIQFSGSGLSTFSAIWGLMSSNQMSFQYVIGGGALATSAYPAGDITGGTIRISYTYNLS